MVSLSDPSGAAHRLDCGGHTTAFGQPLSRVTSDSVAGVLDLDHVPPIPQNARATIAAAILRAGVVGSSSA